MNIHDPVPQTKSQWIGFVAYALIEFVLGHTDHGSIAQIALEVLKYVSGKLIGKIKGK